MTVSFCQTNNTPICVVETFFNFVPLIAFVILGFYSYKEIRNISAYARESFTWRHVTKMAFSILQSLLCFLFLILYLVNEADISLKTVIATAIACFLWLFNSVLMRKEFEKLGFTSKYLKIAWGVMAICELVVLIMGAVGLNTDDFSYIWPVYAASEVSLVVLFVVGTIYSDDYAFYPKQNRNSDLYSSIASDVGLEVDEKDYNILVPKAHKPQHVEERKEEESFKPFESDPSLDGRQERNRRLSSGPQGSRPSTTSTTNWRASNTSVQINLKDEINNVDLISVINFEDTMRFDKQTILYIIEYYIKGHRFITKRSYSEFLYLWKEIKKDEIMIDLPDMPAKKPLLGKTEEVIAERREAFDKFLKILVREKVALNYLREFLQTPNNLPYYGKISKKDSGKLVPPNNSVLSEYEATGRKTNDSSIKPLNKSSISQVVQPQLDSSMRQSRHSQSRHSHTGSRLNHYSIETEKLFRGSDNSIYYTLRVKETGSGAELCIVKRYREFKAFHEQFKKSVEKRHRDQIPDLPHKGKAGAFTSADDPKVTDYRKNELPNYLQMILNNPDFNGNKVIHAFLSSGVEEDVSSIH